MNQAFFDELYHLILLQDPQQKCAGVDEVYSYAKTDKLTYSNQTQISPALSIENAGLPTQIELVYPRSLKRRSIQSQQGRDVLMHSIAHIEFNAINLALDAAYRFRDQPIKYYQQWLAVAADEARHFQMVNDYLNNHQCEYGDYPAHNGLWDMATRTQHDVIARMALVPRVLEARGLDVTPKIISRLKSVGDLTAVNILEQIYQDEITHVNIGSHWFKHHCQLRQLEPRQTFLSLVNEHLHGDLKGPLNTSARLLAGFEAQELEQLLKNS